MAIVLNDAMMSSLFGKRKTAFDSAIRGAVSGHSREFLQSGAGHRFVVIAFSDAVVAAEPTLNLEGSSRVCVNYYDMPMPGIDVQLGVPSLRLDIPTSVLRGKGKPVFWLYNIRFQMLAEDAEVDARGMRPFRVGYFGITKRSVFERFKEHQMKVKNGGGHILHKAWRALIETEMSFHPVVQISATRKNLDEIYEVEEHAVAERSLTPMGLNAIPGGYAGIKMLHQLALLSGNRRVLPEDRDVALENLERSAAGRCTHYRSGHIRHLPSGKSTWVSPCWVNLVKEAGAT